ncbi:aldose epimerase family protein [Flavobacterium sp. SUN052]|uniref:aldose epimerase family protein n=1 Tax=Flavobacterium sp. SUN052 TaxID=3002441 RepID=UPI00237DDE71|nr:aldose epimerase family protein [Flavobacterium sp. SUN052]MEC4004572.1 aldose epimerase family protein [Flavobacterium sp. SUN052]
MEKNHYQQIEVPIFSKSFGFDSNENEVIQYTLTNNNGCAFSVINYGATITSLKITNELGEKIDVVLGFETIEDYINSYNLPSAPYFGTTVGRFAGRINKAEFQLNEKLISLNKNHGKHNLHGGNFGFGRKFWHLKSIHNDENPSITLAYTSPNNEEGFPGELLVEVTYTLTEANELKVSYQAKSTQDTVINLTQHSYFNLEGHSETVLNQKLVINSNKILETTDELIPTGNYVSLKNHPFDFSEIKNCPTSIDNTFVLENSKAAVLTSDKTKLKMTVTTNQPAVHIYVGGNCFNQIKGKENMNYHTTSGICFETQNFPDAPNHSNFPNSILKKDEIYIHNTIFKFENL